MNKEQLARQLHEWYLEATKELHPESYNPNAQKAYDDMTEEQKFIDRYIAQKMLSKFDAYTEEMIEKIEKEKCIVPEEPYANKIDDLTIEFIDSLMKYAGRFNYNKAIDDILSILSKSKVSDSK